MIPQLNMRGAIIIKLTMHNFVYRFTTYQDARRVRLVDGLETNILRVSPVKILFVEQNL